jgi:autotransporter-associated beta strand protein
MPTIRSARRTRKPSLLRPFPSLRFEELESRLSPATFTWSGAGATALWSNGLNWVGGVAPTGNPAAADDLVFPLGAAKLTAQNDISGATFNSISFGAGGYTLTGSDITLGVPALVGTGFLVVNAGSTGNVIQLNVQLGASAGSDQTFSVLAGADLTVTGKLSGTTGATFTKDGGGVLTFTADNSGFTGTMRLNNNSGSLVITHPLALGSITAPTIVGTGSSLRLSNVVGPINEPLILNGLGVANDGALLNLAGNNIWNGPITLDSNAAIGANNGKLTINGKIGDLGPGWGILKEGPGEVQLTAANTYRGTTAVNHGILTVTNAKALGAAGSAASGTVVNSTPTGQGQLRLASTGLNFTIVNEFLTLNGAGSAPVPGSLTNTVGNNTWAGPVTLGSASPNGSDVMIGAAENTNLTISGIISSPNGDFDLVKRDLGRVIFNNANTYTGFTSVQEGILNIRDSLGLGSTAAGTSVSNGATLELQVEAMDPATIPQFDAQGRDLGKDSVTLDPHRLLINETLSISGRGVAEGGALRSISGINRWVANISLTGAVNVQAAIGVDQDLRPGHPTPDASYFISDYSLTVGDPSTSQGQISSSKTTDFVKRGEGHLILPIANPSLGGLVRIEQGWVTMQNVLSLGKNTPTLSQTVQPATYVSNNAALHIRPLSPGTPMTIFENVNIAGLGPAHPYQFINKKGSLMNLDGNNVWAGEIGLLGQAGIGVEQVIPGSTSDLITTGSISDGKNIFNLVASGGEEEQAFSVDTGVNGGKIFAQYEMFGIPDRLTVYYPSRALGGALILDTGLVSNSKLVAINYGPGASTIVELVMNEGGGEPGTAWELSVIIPTNGGSIVKMGSKRLNIQGDGTYTGDNEVREGTLRLYNDTALGLSSSGTFTTQQDFPLTSTAVSAGAVIEITGGIARLNGGIASGTQYWNEQLILNSAGQIVSIAGAGGTFDLTYNGKTTGKISIDALPSVVESELNALSSIIADVGSVSVSKIDNSYVVVFGTTQSKNAAALSAVAYDGAEVAVSGGNAPLVNLDNDNAWRGPITLNEGSRVNVSPNSRLSLLGPIDDVSNKSVNGSDFVKRGTGGLVLAGNNSFRGTFVIDEGVTTAMSSTAFGATSGGTVVANGAQLQLQGSLTVAGEPLTVQGTGPATPPNLGVAGPRWLNTGPAPTNNGHTNLNLPTAGRITSIATDPSDSNVIYVATAGGGAWKSKNGGLTWLPLFDATVDPAAVMFGGWIQVSPNDSRVVYFATGESNGTPNGAPIPGPGDNYAGSGLYRSNDAGESWVLVNDNGANPLSGQMITKLIIDPANTNQIYLSTGVTNVLNGNPNARPGVYRVNTSSSGAGTFTNLTASISPARQNTNGQAPYDAPTNGVGPPQTPGPDDDYRITFPQSNVTWSDILLIGGTLFAALGEGPEQAFTWSGTAGTAPTSQAVRHAVYRTTNPTADNPAWFLGATGVDNRPTAFPIGTITDGTGPNGYIKLAGVANTAIMASVVNPANGDLLYIQRSGDGGVTWTNTPLVPPSPFGAPILTGNPPVLTAQGLGRYNHAFVAGGGNFYLGGVGVYTTTDFGANWTTLTPDQAGAAPAEGIHSLFFDVDSRLLIGSDGGAWMYDGFSFSNLNGTLAVAQLNSADPHPTNFGLAYAGTQDNGIQQFANNLNWNRVDDNTGKNAGVVRYDSQNPMTAYAVRDGVIRKTTNGGASWVTIFTGSTTENYVPFIVDSISPSRLLIGGNTLTESINGGASFVNLNPGIAVRIIGQATNQGPFVLDNDFPTVADQLSNTYDPSTIYVSDGSVIRVTKNRGVSWASNRIPSRVLTVTFGGALGTIDVDQITGTAGTVIGGTLRNGSAGGAEIQTLSIVNTGAGFTLTFNGETTGTLAFNASAVDIANAINNLPGMITSGGTVNVTLNSFTIQDLAVDPSNRDTVYAVLNYGWNVPGARVVRSTDAGQTWTDISGSSASNLPQDPTWRIVIDPRTGTAYVGNDTGVYSLPNASTTSTFNWTRFGAGLPSVQVKDIVLNQQLSTLTIGTYGRGMYQLILPDFQPSTGALRAVSGSSVWTGPVTLAGDTTISTAGNQNIQNGIAAATLNILGTIGDQGAGNKLIKIGEGTLILSGTNTYSGQTLVEEGIVQVNNPQALGATSPAATANTIVTAGAALELRSDLELEPVTINGNGIPFNGHFTGALRNVSNNNVYTGVLTFGTNTTIGVDSGTSLTIGERPGVLAGIGSMTDNGSNFSLDKELTGTLILASANTYGGQTFVNQGPLQIQSPDALGAATGLTDGTVVLDGAQLQLARNAVSQLPTVVSNEHLSLSGTGIFGSGALLNVRGDTAPGGSHSNSWNGPILLTITPNFAPPTNPGTQIGIGVSDDLDTLTINGIISQDSALASFGLIKVGPGRLTLTQANTFTGITTVNDGWLRVQNNAALGPVASNEVQTIAVFGVTGTYSLVFNGQATANLAATASAATVQAALESLTTIGAGNVLVSETPGLNGKTLTVTFQGTFANLDVPLLTGTVGGPSAPPTINILNAQRGGLGTVVNAGGTLELDATLGSLTFPEVLLLGSDGSGNIGGLTSAIGDNTYSGAITLSANSSFGATVGNTLTVTGLISDPTPQTVPAPRLRKADLGTVVFPNSNQYSGQTIVDEGVLRFQNPLSLGTTRTETQSLSIFLTAGTFTLTFNNAISSPLAFNATATDVQTALNALATIGGVGGSVTVTSAAVPGGTRFDVTFGGTLANQNVSQIVMSTVVVNTTTEGSAGGSEVQTLQVIASAGTFTLTFNGQTTNPLPFDASGFVIQSALNSLTTIGGIGGSVTVTNVPGGFTITFGGTLANTNVSQLIPTDFTTGFNTGQPFFAATTADGLGSEAQVVRVIATNGTFSLTFNGQTTTAIPFNASAAVVQSVLNVLSSISGVGGIVGVTAHTTQGGNVYTITFGGSLGNANLPAMTATVTGGTVVTVTTANDGPEGTSVTSGATLQIDGGITMTNEVVTINGPGFNDQGALNNFSGNNTWATPLFLGSNASVGTTSASETLTFTAPIDDNGNAFNLDIVGPGTVTYASTLDNRYTGTTHVQNGTLLLSQTTGLAIVGPLVVGDVAPSTNAVVRETLDNQIGDTVPVTVNETGLFDLNGKQDQIGTLTVNAGNVTTGNNGILTTDDITMSAGTISIGTLGQLVMLGDLTATSTTTGAAAISLDGTINLNGADRTFDITDGPLDIDLIITSAIVPAGSEGIIKTGVGRLVLSPLFSPFYAGPTTIQEGDVQVDTLVGEIRLDGGTLSGTGTTGPINGTPSSAPAVGIVSPGDVINDAGILTSGVAVWGPDTTYNVTLSTTISGLPAVGTDYDQLSVIGSINLGGAELTGTFGSGIAVGDRFTIITASGGVIGRFAEPFGPNVVFIEGQKFFVDYNNPNEVVLEKIRANVTVTVTSSVNPSTFGQVVFFTATVVAEPGAGPIPVGTTVTFTLDSIAFPAVTVTSAGTTVVTVWDPQAALGGAIQPGIHPVTATFNGDPLNFNSGTGTLTPPQEVQVPVIDPLQQTEQFISPNNSPGVQDSVTFSTTVQFERLATDWTITIANAGGTIVRTFNGSFSGTGANDPISATWNGRDSLNQFVPDGPYTVVASFTDSFGNTGSTPPIIVTVDNTSPTANAPAIPVPIIAPGTASTVPTTAPLGGAIADLNLASWMMTVSNSGGTVVRTYTGTTNQSVLGFSVTWDGRNQSGIIVPDGIYTVSLTSTDLAGNVSAVSTNTIVVLTVPPALSVTSVSPTIYGDAITFTSTISVTIPSVAPFLVGTTIRFMNGTTLLGTGTVANVGGIYTATLSVPTFNAGTYSNIQAVYPGTIHFLPSSSPLYTHTVLPKAITVTADNQTRLYGDPNPPFTFQVVGLTNNDTIANVFTGTPATTATITSPVGSYPITKGTLQQSSNYTMTFVNGILTITPAPLTIDIDDATRRVRDPNPEFTAQFIGLKVGDQPSVVTGYTLATTATIDSKVGTYPIITQGTPTAQNYSITVLPGTMTITRRPDDFAVGSGPGGVARITRFTPNGDYVTTVTPFNFDFRGGVRVAATDLDNDGFTETIQGTGPGTRNMVTVMTGNAPFESVMTQFFPFEASYTGGIFVTTGFIDGDNVPDIIVTPDQSGGPRVQVYRGTDFVKIADFFGIDDPNFRGGARAAAGDINGDGVDDLVIAAGFGGGPRIATFNGKAIAVNSPQKLFGDFFAFEQTLRNGVFVAVGDVNGDGRADIFAGGGPGGGPRITAFSGKTLIQNGTLNPLVNFFAGDPNNRGGIRLAVKDVDGDNRADLVVGAGEKAGSRVTIYKGVDLLGNPNPNVHNLFDAFTDALDGVFVG